MAAESLDELARRLAERIAAAPGDSYTARLAGASELLRAKLIEEAGELADAATRDEVIHEAADVVCFTLVTMAKSSVDLVEVERELERRSLRVSRRSGDAKAADCRQRAAMEEER